MLKLLDRLAGKINRKVTPTAATMAAENAPTTNAPVAVTEIQKEQAEET